MKPEFTAHNIVLDDGTQTKPDHDRTMDRYPWFQSARRVFELAFPGDRSRVRVLDVGCLEGGYSVELARLGFDVTGLEVRESNLACCRWVRERVDLPNLRFVQGDAMDLPALGGFDAIFCCGLLYHLDEPRRFLNMSAAAASKLLYLQTHFSTARENARFNLSPLTVHEGVSGRWFTEYADEATFQQRDELRWASWNNRRSFWIRREAILHLLQELGYDLVLEQFDGLGDSIAHALTQGYYFTDERGTFIGIRTSK
jgi:2-polyprenyl-3-methyl-5-hydroxy-6-metoxy-1,4-benzoquinol methylase